jgi:hypothetical protein
MLYEFIKRLDTETRLGKRAISHVIPEQYRKRFSASFKDKSRSRMIEKVCRPSGTHLKDMFQTCLKHIKPVTEPLALVSQIQRSGGSLLSQLLDGHPEIHAHPHELMLGYKKKFIWPRIDLNDSPERWFAVLFEKMVVDHTAKGYKKGRRDREPFPFIFVPGLQRRIFLEYLESIQPVELRDVFNAYMTSYFGAWLSNQNYNGRKKIVTAFAPWLSTVEESVDLFFEIYPDGRLISLVRDPRNWFPSALRHAPEKYGNLERAIDRWEKSARAMLRNKNRYGNRVCLVRFEDLVGKTSAVMHYFAKSLGIEFNEVLLVPTFNKFPIKAHTSFKVQNHGIVKGPLSRSSTLTRQQLDAIEKMTDETYSRVLSEVVRFE